MAFLTFLPGLGDELFYIEIVVVFVFSFSKAVFYFRL